MQQEQSGSQTRTCRESVLWNIRMLRLIFFWIYTDLCKPPLQTTDFFAFVINGNDKVPGTEPVDLREVVAIEEHRGAGWLAGSYAAYAARCCDDGAREHCEST